MSEQNLVIAAVAAIVIVSLFTKLRIMPKKNFKYCLMLSFLRMCTLAFNITTLE